MKEAIELFAMMVAPAIPYAVVWALGERFITMFLGAAFKGRLEI